MIALESLSISVRMQFFASHRDSWIYCLLGKSEAEVNATFLQGQPGFDEGINDPTQSLFR